MEYSKKELTRMVDRHTIFFNDIDFCKENNFCRMKKAIILFFFSSYSRHNMVTEKGITVKISLMV